MGTVGTITAKDLRQRARDRSVLMFAFVVPIGLTYVFSLVFGGLAEGSLGDLSFGVVDRDDGPVSDAFTERYLPVVAGFLSADDGIQVDVVALEGGDDAAQQAVLDGRVQVAFVLPSGLSGAFTQATAFDVEVVTSADADLAGDVATAIAERFVQRARGQAAARVLAERLQLPPERAAELAASVGSVQGRIRLDAATSSDRQLDLSTYLAAGMAVFFLFFTVQFGVLGYLEERQNGTLARLLASPISRWQVVAAKGLVSVIVGIVSVATLMLVAIPMLGASWGAPLAVSALVLAAVLAATSLVAAITTLARTPEQANVWQSVVAVVLGMLGGSFFPIQGSAWLDALSLVTPHAWFLRGLSTLADPATGVGDVLLPIGAMLAFGAVFGGIGLVLSRREVRE